MSRRTQGDHPERDHQKTLCRRLCHGVTAQNKSSIYSRCLRDAASYGAFWLLLPDATLGKFRNQDEKLLKVQHQSCVLVLFLFIFLIIGISGLLSLNFFHSYSAGCCKLLSELQLITLTEVNKGISKHPRLGLISNKGCYVVSGAEATG